MSLNEVVEEYLAGRKPVSAVREELVRRLVAELSECPAYALGRTVGAIDGLLSALEEAKRLPPDAAGEERLAELQASARRKLRVA